MKESIQLKAKFNEKPSVLYKAWLNGKSHSAMTGGEAICEPNINTKFTAWDGYISGQNKELIEDTKIVQSWRTSEFNEDEEDSKLIILFKAVENGTELTLIHTNIPEGQTQYENGWIEHYIEPMTSYFNT
jgi:activator of HSP90 ATPase